MTTTALTVSAQQSAVVPFEPENFSQAQTMAIELSKSDLVPSHLRGKPANVLLVVMRGRELGISPMQSLRMNVINGNVGLPADMMVALVKRQPECEAFRCTKRTETVATWVSKRRNQEPVEHSFTIEKAKKAGLLKSAMYAQWTDNMLMWRAASELCRMEWPEVFAGVYSADEIADMRGEQHQPDTTGHQMREEVHADLPRQQFHAEAQAEVVHDEVPQRKETPAPATHPAITDDQLAGGFLLRLNEAEMACDPSALDVLYADIKAATWQKKTRAEPCAYATLANEFTAAKSRVTQRLKAAEIKSAREDVPHVKPNTDGVSEQMGDA